VKRTCHGQGTIVESRPASRREIIQGNDLSQSFSNLNAGSHPQIGRPEETRERLLNGSALAPDAAEVAAGVPNNEKTAKNCLLTSE